MKRLFDSLFRRLPAPIAHPPSTPVRHGDLIHPDTSAYLPVAPAQLLSLFSGHIAAIRQTFPSLEEFNGVPARLIADLANYLHLLPASFSHHHRDPGGAFRHALEVGCYAARSAKPLTITPHIGGRRRYDEEAQKCTVAFLLGALHDIGKPFNDYRVCSADAPAIQWVPNQRSLYDWARDHAPTGYFVKRVDDYNYRNHISNLPVDSTHLASRHLTALKPEAYRMYRDALRNPEHPLWKAVESADRISAVRDTSLSAATQSFLPQLTCDAIHHLVTNCSDWKPNSLSSHIHLTASTIYVSYPDGISQIHAQMLAMDPRTPRPMSSFLHSLQEIGCAYTSPRNVYIHTFYLNLDKVSKESNFVCIAAHLAPELYPTFGATDLLAEAPNRQVAESPKPIEAPPTSTILSATTMHAKECVSDHVAVRNAEGSPTPDAPVVTNGKLPIKPRQKAESSRGRTGPSPISRIVDDCNKGVMKIGPIGPSSMDLVEGSLRIPVQNAIQYFPALPDPARQDNFLKAYAMVHESDGYIWPDDTVRLTTNATSAILEKVNRSQSNG